MCTRKEAAEADIITMQNGWRLFGIQFFSGSFSDSFAISRPIRASLCRLVIPYHWCWARARFRKVLAEYQLEAERVLQLDATLSVSWSLGYQHLSSRIARGSGVYHSYSVFTEV